jgi:hypothetical protein
LRNTALGSDVIGGYVGNGTGNATNNKVKLSGEINLSSAGLNLSGGAGGVTDTRTGNTLEMNEVDYGSGPSSFGTISNFENYNLTVTSKQAQDASSSLPTSLLVATTIDLGTDANLVVNVTGQGQLTVGQKLTVMTGTTPLSGNVKVLAVGSQGLFREYVYNTSATSTEIFAEVEEVITRADTKALSELPLADVSFVNRGSDLIAGQGIPAAMTSIAGNVGVVAFATVGYGWHRAETGSHVDVKGMNGDVGIAFGTETSAGPFAAGAFVEFGDGTFDSYNEFAGIPSVHGEGDLSYIGGGVFARLDLGQSDASRPYFEASVRFGKTDAEFRTRDFQLANGREIKYDFDAKYWGFHVGGGYIIDFSSFDGTLDLSAKYFHTDREGDDFLIDGERASLSSVTSSRVKAGGRLTAGLTPSIKTYFGLYYEYEFDGDSHVTFAGTDLPKVTLGGSTGIGELGLIVSTPDSPLEVQMGVEGSAGSRDGISANLSLRFTF